MIFSKIKQGSIIEVIFYDHEREDNTEDSDVLKKDIEECKAYGIYRGTTKNCIVISNWYSQSTSDIYRILKKDILKIKVMK